MGETKYHITLLVSLGDQKILSRISRKSYAEISLTEGTRVFVQVKAVSIHDLTTTIDDTAD